MIKKKIFFKQKTAYEIMSGDWSSDVCSSDLIREAVARQRHLPPKIKVLVFSRPYFGPCVLAWSSRATCPSYISCGRCVLAESVAVAYGLRFGRVTIRRNHRERLGFRGDTALAILCVSAD